MDEAMSRESTQTTSISWAHEVLDAWHVGVVVFSATGHQLYASRAARALAASGDGFSLASDGPVAATVRQTRALRELISKFGDGTNSGIEWLRLSRPSGGRPYEVALCRLSGVNPADPRVAMFVAAPDAQFGVNASALRKLHGLTDLESQVAQCLMRGLAIRKISSELGLTLQTTRWYVQQLREKVDAASQSDLLRFMIRGITGVEVPCQPESIAKQN